MRRESQAKARIPVLTATRAVCRACFPLYDMEALRHVVELLDGYLDTFSSSWTVKKACRAGLPRRALDYLAARDQDKDWGRNDFETRWIATHVVRSGAVHVLQWMEEHYPVSVTWNAQHELTLLEEAARFGRLTTLEWLHVNLKEGCGPWAMDKAAANGHLDVVQWLHGHRTEGCTSFAMDEAARKGHLEVVRFLHENRHEGCTTKAMNLACASGHLAVAKYLHENRREGCTVWAMNLAAWGGHLEVVQWLCANRSEGKPGQALGFAAEGGQTAVVEWLYEVVRGRRRGYARIQSAVKRAEEAGYAETSQRLKRQLKQPRRLQQH
jgi:hypothetical protein